MISKRIISLLLFLYVLSILVFDNARYVKLVYFFDVLLIGYYIVYYVQTNAKVYSNLIISFLVLFTILTITSLFWTPNFMWGFTRSISMVFICINTFIIYNILKNFNNIEYIFYAFFAFVLFNFLILNNVLGFEEYYYSSIRFQGTTTNPNLVAIYSIFSIFISLYILLRESVSSKLYIIFLYLNLIMSFLLIIYSGSKKGILFSALLIIMYLVIWLRPSKKLFSRLIVLFFLIGTGLYLLQFVIDIEELFYIMEKTYGRIENMLLAIDNSANTDKSTLHRIHLINEGLKHFSNNVFFGLGTTGFAYYEGVYSHNNYVEILANFGFFGFIIYYSIYLFTIVKAFSIQSRIIKIYLISTVFIILIMDIGLVSYFSKIYFIILISIYYLSEYLPNENIRTNYEKK